MKIIKKLFNGIHIFMGYFGVVQLLAMTIIVSVQVFCRFLLGFSISWAEEVSLILMIWFSMISMAIGVKKRLHIAIELFTMKLSEKVMKNVINKITDVCTIVFSMVLIYYGWLLVENGLMSTLPATGFRSSMEYIFTPIAGILIAYDSIMDLFGIDKEDESFERIFTGGEHTNA
ncbi:MAG: TRAP transporter small permease [Clostridia bacterium]|nr:TRAP transporter small permease [Clostridia bacterium]